MTGEAVSAASLWKGETAIIGIRQRAGEHVDHKTAGYSRIVSQYVYLLLRGISPAPVAKPLPITTRRRQRIASEEIMMAC